MNVQYRETVLVYMAQCGLGRSHRLPEMPVLTSRAAQCINDQL